MSLKILTSSNIDINIFIIEYKYLFERSINISNTQVNSIDRTYQSSTMINNNSTFQNKFGGDHSPNKTDVIVLLRK